MSGQIMDAASAKRPAEPRRGRAANLLDEPGAAAAGMLPAPRIVVPAGEPPAPPDPETPVPVLRGGPVTRHRMRRPGSLTTGLVLADLLVMAATLGIVVIERAADRLWTVPFLCLSLVLTRSAFRMHRSRLRLSWAEDFPRSLAALAVTVGIAATALALGAVAPHVVVVLAGAVALAWVAAEVVRGLVLHAARRSRIKHGPKERTLVFGAGTVGRDLVETMRAHPEFGLAPVGVVDPSPRLPAVEFAVPLFTCDLGTAIRAQRADTVVLAFSGQSESSTVDAAITANGLGCTVMLVPRLFEIYLDSTGVERLRSYPLVRLPDEPTRRASWRVKRALDVVLAGLALLATAPVLAACALAILIESGRPVFFVQQRVGMDGRPFPLVKLRSLRPADEHESQTRWNVAHDDRIGRVGRILRRTSLDELPQLWNIVRGEMSLVGPRPERPGFVHTFTMQHERYGARLRVPAGLTGLAQVNGLRGDTSIADRARFDNYYIATWSLWLDARIVALTLRELVRRGEY